MKPQPALNWLIPVIAVWFTVVLFRNFSEETPKGNIINNKKGIRNERYSIS